MADYFTLLSRAVASLDDNTRDEREALYNRSRNALMERLRAADPPWTDEQIEAEAASLDAAIWQIEFAAARSPAERDTHGTRPHANEAQRRISAAPHAETIPALPRPPSGRFSPTLVSILGAIALAIIAAAVYAYLSRPATKPPASATRTDGNTVGLPKAGQRDPRPKQAKTDTAATSPLNYVLQRQLVYYRSPHAAGTIVIAKSQHMLYQVRGETVALRYSIAVGPQCLEAIGLHRVVRKEMWPAWPPVPADAHPQPPPTSSANHRTDSPLGARALVLSDLEYGIHGTNKVSAVGRNASFGCFALTDDDITDLYDRVPADTRVVIMN